MNFNNGESDCYNGYKEDMDCDGYREDTDFCNGYKERYNFTFKLYISF